MIATRTNYAHYLYDERVGIKEKEYKCNVPWGGIILETKDNYLALGEMDKTTSVPYCLQIPGGGIDKKDIYKSNYKKITKGINKFKFRRI